MKELRKYHSQIVMETCHFHQENQRNRNVSTDFNNIRMDRRCFSTIVRDTPQFLGFPIGVYNSTRDRSSLGLFPKLATDVLQMRHAKSSLEDSRLRKYNDVGSSVWKGTLVIRDPVFQRLA